MGEKITDTNEMKAESLRKMREAVGFPSAGGSSDGASASGSSPKPVASIAIKRKADVEDKGKNGEKEKNGEDAMEETEEKAESDVEGGEKEGEDKSAQVGIYVQ